MERSGRHVGWDLLPTGPTGSARKLSSPGLVGLGVSEWFGNTLQSGILHGGKKKKGGGVLGDLHVREISSWQKNFS